MVSDLQKCTSVNCRQEGGGGGGGGGGRLLLGILGEGVPPGSHISILFLFVWN